MQILDLFKSDLFSDFRLLAGNGGIFNSITGITVFDAPDIDKWLRGGELLIGNAYIFRENQEAFITFLQRVREHGASAVGIKLDRFLGDISQRILDTADEINLPLIVIPFSYRWADIIELVSRNIAKTTFSDFVPGEGKALEFFTKPSQLIHAMAKELQRPVAARCHALGLSLLVRPAQASSSYPTAQAYFQADIQDEEALPPHGAVQVSKEKRHSNFATASVAYRTEGQAACEMHILLNPNENTLSLHDERLAILVLNVLHALALDSVSRGAALVETKSAFLQKLCLGEVSDMRIASRKAQALGIRIPEESFVTVAHTAEPEPALNCGGEALAFQMGRNYVLIAPWSERTTYMKIISAFCSQNAIWSVFGRKSGDIVHISSSYTDCKRSLAILKKTFLPPGAYAYEEAMLFSMFHKVKDTLESRVLIDRYWKPLVEMSGDNRTVQPVDVVAALIQNGFNAKKSAESLHVHYNSIRNYIAEIQQSTGMNFEKPMDLFLLTFCYLLIKEKEKTQPMP